MDAAESLALDIVSPAMREGVINYSFEERASFVTTRMRDLARLGFPHGVCFAVRNRVFEKIGRFDEAFQFGQFEDTDFFRRASAAGFSSATVGASFIHHFSSVTQNYLREKQVSSYEAENRAYFRRKWNLHWFKRKLEKLNAARRLRDFVSEERAVSGSILIDRSL
jgi:GT2 family glycosyltransferase